MVVSKQINLLNYKLKKMKYLSSLFLVYLLSAFSNMAFSQNNNIGVNISINDLSGLNTELRYEKFVNSRWLVGTGVASNFRSSVSLTVGFKYDLLKRTNFSLLTGIDYRFEFIKLHITDNNTKRQNSLEVPLELRYKFSDNLSLNVGFSIPFSLDKGRQNEYLFNSYMIGIVKRF